MASQKKHEVVSRQDWITARKALLKTEKEFTHMRERLARGAPSAALGKNRKRICFRRREGQRNVGGFVR